MEIKLLQSLGEIPKGTILLVEKITVDLQPDLCVYHVIDGPNLGLTIYSNSKVILELPEEKTFTEQEVKAIEAVHLAKLNVERAAKERAQELVKGLTEALNAKNKQIETLDSYVNVLAIVVKYAAEAIERLRSMEKAQ